jgi:ribosomal protein S18 acetylase RimI-like enzyme
MRHDRGVRFAESTVSPRVLAWTGEQFAQRLDEAMSIYVAAMGYSPSAGHQRALTARNHVHIDGFACRAAVLDDGTLVGFGYGYTTARGQWWHDLVRRALPRDIAAEWLDGAFELSELHMLPSYQGRGIGRQVLTQLADTIPHRTILLSTPDAETRAFRLYHALGFVDLRRNYLFPGDSRPFAVLGARLPLRSDGA